MGETRRLPSALLGLSAASRPDGEGDHIGNIALEIIRQRVQLVLPMAYTVTRSQPVEFGAFGLVGSEPVMR